MDVEIECSECGEFYKADSGNDWSDCPECGEENRVDRNKNKKERKSMQPTQRREDRGGDLILAPGEYSFILDGSKGHVGVWTGPTKSSLSETDKPVLFNEGTKTFEICSVDEARQLCPVAPEGWYVVLKNPAISDSEQKHPREGSSTTPQLNIGHKVNVPGPCMFGLWPGQMASVLQGHHLRSNQYLITQVYDEESAVKNWGQAVMKPQTEGGEEDNKPEAIAIEKPDLTMGKLNIIKGTDVSFYIPPTGIKIIPDKESNYVRDAVTLERLEYCILLDEDGNKRYKQGPDVIFPSPTETLVERNGKKKFRAIELNDLIGIYVKVIANYKEGGKEYTAGDELFLTGKDSRIYFPRPEHAVIKYGDSKLHYAIAIPKGEARYVLNRTSGTIELKKGPSMYLPDPRTDVVVKRVIEDDSVRLWFPGNTEAVKVNQTLKELSASSDIFGKGYVSERCLTNTGSMAKKLRTAGVSYGDLAGLDTMDFAEMEESDSNGDAVMGDELDRKTNFTPPRSITLDTKYDGAVAINIWSGYAIQVVNKVGERKVVVGPQTVLLEYDEYLEKVALSTGKPKTTDRLHETVYLRVLNNYITDIIEVETKDFCKLRIKLIYRVNFCGEEPSKWFSVENYVKFLCDHMRSMLKSEIRQFEVEDFYADSTNIISKIVLGKGEKIFEENNMKIYNVETMDVKIEDHTISELLVDAKHQSIQQNLQYSKIEKEYEVTSKTEEIRRKISQVRNETRTKEIELEMEVTDKIKTQRLAKIQANDSETKAELTNELKNQEQVDAIKKSELAITQRERETEIGFEEKLKDIDIKAVKEKMAAISPELAKAINNLGDKELVSKLSENMSVLSILGGKSVSDILCKTLKGTPVEKILKSVMSEKK